MSALTWVLLIGLGLLFIACVVLPSVWLVGRLTYVPRRRRQFMKARQQVDEVFEQAHIRMEEVAGVRRPGEKRLTDGLGSWRQWLCTGSGDFCCS